MKKQHKKSRDNGASLMFQAPMVMAMRMPLLFIEMAGWQPGRRVVETERAVAEKMAAGFETVGKVQAEMLAAWGRVWTDALSGTAMTYEGAVAQWDKVAQTSMEPYARRVALNATRLQRR